MIRSLPIFGAAAMLAVGAVVALTASAAAQEGDEVPGAPPIVTVVNPGVVTVVPQQTVVAPIQSTVEERTEDASLGLAGEQSGGNLFTGVRGGFIGAGIAFGVVLALAVAVAAVRRGFNRVRQ